MHPNFFLIPSLEAFELDDEAEEMDDDRELVGDMVDGSFLVGSIRIQGEGGSSLDRC